MRQREMFDYPDDGYTDVFCGPILGFGGARILIWLAEAEQTSTS